MGHFWGNFGVDHQKLQDQLQRVVALGRELKSFIRLASLIPSKGYGGIIPPIKELPSPLVTAAPAPDDRRQSIRAFTTVRPIRVP